MYNIVIKTKCLILQDDDVEVMDDDDDDDDDDIPVVMVGGEEIDITDITPDIIAKVK